MQTDDTVIMSLVALIFLWNGVQHQRIACIRNQTDRNILKVKNTIMKKLRKKLYVSLCEHQQMNFSLNQQEKDFLEDYASVFADKNKAKVSDTD